MVKKNKDAPKSLNYQIDHLTEKIDMGVSENSGTPKSSILMWFSHPFGGKPTIFGNTHMEKGTLSKNCQKKTLCKVVVPLHFAICKKKKKSTKTPARTCGPRTRVQEA